MKRGYSKEWFIQRANRLRELVPEVHIGTDIIVGFPGESDQDFEDTMDVVEQVKFEQMFSFKYSPRPLTKASEFTNQVSDEVASKRLKRLQDRHTQILDDITNATKDDVMRVYFDELKSGGEITGRSYSNFLVNVKGSEELLGKTRDVRIIRPQRTTLYGEIVG
jgi:tRNA-2-methylthio-N6-dimethylallyladenosine synthase